MRKIFDTTKTKIIGFLKNFYNYYLIKQSGLFDTEYYLTNYTDVRKADIDPVWHYIKFGWKEGRNPSLYYNTNFYLDKNTDVTDENINPLFHYIKFGKGEGRDPKPQIQWIYPSSIKGLDCDVPFVNDISNIKNNIPKIHHKPITEREKISVIVTTYNHEKYIKQCLESILCQKGDFNLEIIIGDDCSTDQTKEIIQNYEEEFSDIIFILKSQENMGITKNLKRCLDACNGLYVAICEGDDYWIDEYKLQKQMILLSSNDHFSMVYSSIFINYEGDERLFFFNKEKPLINNEITTNALIDYNYIGNFSCCMYKIKTIRSLPEDLFNLFIVDWAFNIACSEIGNIGFLDEYMSVYRKHAKGAWSGKSVHARNNELLLLIDTYDNYFKYKYHNGFQEYKEKIKYHDKHFQDLIILDTVFPHPLSPFRYQEFISIMEALPGSLVLTTGEHLPAFKETRKIQEIIEDFENKNPHLQGRTFPISHNIAPFNAYLAYIEFLTNMKIFLPSIEKHRIPFIFTLYPGGGFKLNETESDKELRKICLSNQFRKIIVTQNITYDYLINKDICKPEQMEFIYGVVSPINVFNKHINRKYYGIDKDTLDICFVAHKYMKKGIDKGYDIFIDVAKRLVDSYDNIFFHVVGSFDESDIPLGALDKKIFFYGLRNQDWFDDFFIDKDIILSPNIPFVLLEGTFDGFPTASCTEAGARGVAILCTDILALNMKFIDNEDIIIIPHNPEKIISIIAELHTNPIKLKKISQNGAEKIREIYNYENQISPRINIIKSILEAEKGNLLRCI